MLKAKDFVTIFMVIILIALVLINTIGFDSTITTTSLLFKNSSSSHPNSTQNQHHQQSKQLYYNILATTNDSDGANYDNYDAGHGSGEAEAEAAVADQQQPNSRLYEHSVAGKRDDKVTGGQLETFSSKLTGLGDLEGADEFKKMLRKRRALESMRNTLIGQSLAWPTIVIGGGGYDHESYMAQPRQQRQQATLVSQNPLTRLLMTTQFAGNNDDLISRRRHRTVDEDTPLNNNHQWSSNGRRQRQFETQLEQVSGGGGDMLGDEESYEILTNRPSFGEFGSRISLLTMRKDPEPAINVAANPEYNKSIQGNRQRANLIRNENKYNGDIRPPHQAGGGEALATIKGLIKLLGGQHNSTNENIKTTGHQQQQSANEMPDEDDSLTEVSFDPNNLPRIARAFM